MSTTWQDQHDSKERPEKLAELKQLWAAAGHVEIPLYMRMISSVGSAVGHDHGSAVSSRYEGAYGFTGTLHEVVIQLISKQGAAAQEATTRAEMPRQ